MLPSMIILTQLQRNEQEQEYHKDFFLNAFQFVFVGQRDNEHDRDIN